MGMKKRVVLSGVVGTCLLFLAVVCQAERWDKNDYVDASIKVGYYDAQSIKVRNKAVSWTEKYILTSTGVTALNAKLSQHEACKQNIAKNGEVTQYQMDYQIEKGKYRGVAARYYNKANKLICTNKDTGNDLDLSWKTIERATPMQQAQYDLVTKYKIKFQ
jgi:hypothetical protein